MSQIVGQYTSVEQVGEITVVTFTTSKLIEAVSYHEGSDCAPQQCIAKIMGDELFSLVDADNRSKLVLDFSGVDFLSSLALAKFITLDKKIKARCGRLALCNIRPEIYEVFAITKLNRTFDIKDTREEALSAF